MYPLIADAYVPELQEITYTPEVEQVDTATTTQPAMVIATTTAVVAVAVPLKLSEAQVVEEILKVFPDAPIMVQVARCESGLVIHADRKGIDVGLFQINQIHNKRLLQLGLDKRDLHDNLTYARMLYDESGLQPWYMSRHCWSS